MTAIRFLGKESFWVRPSIKFKFDYWLALSVAALLVIGLLMIYSTTFDYGVRFQDGDASYYLRRQLAALTLGLVAAVVVMQFDYHILRNVSVIMLLGVLLLLFVTLFFGETIFGARRGLSEGSYQPSEIAKFVTLLYIAHWLSTKGDRIKNLTYGLVPFSVIVGVVCALIVRQPDLSTATLIALVAYTMFFVAGADWRQLGIAGTIGLVVFVLLVLALPHARDRVDAFADTLRDPNLASWHVQQTLISLANGSWFGVGLGESPQKFGLLPTAHTDSIFAVMTEELGFVGAFVFISLYGLFVWRGFRIAQRARDSFGFLLALGITLWLSFQGLINIAVNTAVIPFSGLPLPFLSYGGSSLAMSLVGVGVLLAISRDVALDKKVQRPTAESYRA